MGYHIGLADIKVVFMDKSPFSGQQKQEVAHYFNSSTFEGMGERKNVDALPQPLVGIRISERFNAFSNFLTDPSGKYLEDAETSYEEPTASSEDSGGSEDTPKTTAAGGGNGLAKARKQIAIGEAKNEKINELEKGFFTWQVSQNLFEISEKNPPPTNFGQSSPRNAPEWSYDLKARPGGEQTNLILTPYMSKCPPDTFSPVHWGVITSGGKKGNGGLAMNQAFQIVYYHDLRNPAIAKDAVPLQPKLRFVYPNGQEMDMRLTNTVYLAIEFGIGSRDDYMLVFRNDLEPHFFKIEGKEKNRNAILIEKLAGFNSSRLFDPNHKHFTVEIESAVGSLIVKNSVSQVPWVINAPLSNPIFIGEGPIALYGGNVQAGFAMRPIQYHSVGSFKTPEASFNFVTRFGDALAGPKCTTALKGAAMVEQIRNYKGQGVTTPEVHMVDAEMVNGEKLTTVLQYGAERATENQSLSREVVTELQEVEVRDRADVQDLEITTKSFLNLVTLKAGYMFQPNGYVVDDGRSPYIFMLRCEVPSVEGEIPLEIQDVTCDVMNIDLNWNATSYNEFKHTGTIRFLNYRQGMENHSKTDYRSYSNRSVYLRIYAGWKNGVGEELGEPIFTGQTLSAEVSTTAEREIVTFQIEDYMAALQGSKFVLSPWYDGMVSSLAVRDIVLMTGFPDQHILTNSTPIVSSNLSQDIGLSFANPFEEPVFKFKDGTSFLEGILQIAKIDFKVVFFDATGKFHYDLMPGGLFANKNYKVKEKFWSMWDAAQAGDATKPENQAFNVRSFSRLINDVYNVLQVFSVEKRTLFRMTGATAYKAGIYDPTAEGYLGYRKHLMIAEPALGSYDAMMGYLDEYRRRLLIPPITAKFEIYGRPSLQPLDIIHLDNEPLRIMNIQTHIDRSENTFYQNIEGEWFKSAGAGKDEQPQLMQPNAVPGGKQSGLSDEGSPGNKSTY